MRKFGLPLLSVICISACNLVNDDFYEPMTDQIDHTVTIEEAEQTLLAFLSEDSAVTRSLGGREIVSRYPSGGPSTKSGDEESPLVYVFNFSDSLGFAIMSGDDRLPPILCVTEKGSLEQGATIECSGFAMMLSEIETYCRLKMGLPVYDTDGNELNLMIDTYEPDIDTASYVHNYVFEYGPWQNYSTIGTVIPCEWGQDSPFNGNCITSDGYTAKVGCASVAVAQIMYYWGKSVYYKNRYWDWTLMREVQNSKSAPTDPQCWTLVKQFLRVLGNTDDLDVSYGTDGSEADRYNVPRTFEHFGYASGGMIEDYDYSKVRSALISGRPVLGAGYSIKKEEKVLGITVNTSYSKGHEWVFDQILIRRRLVDKYELGYYLDSFYQTQDLVHINWGWAGDCNGYFLPTYFYAKDPVTKSTTTYGKEKYYQFDLQMNCGIVAN